MNRSPDHQVDTESLKQCAERARIVVQDGDARTRQGGVGGNLEHPRRVRDDQVPGRLPIRAGRALAHAVANTDQVMAITDHLTADARLIDYALLFTAESGTCWLTHIESRRQLARFQAAVEKIPGIETDDVRELVEAQLLKEPRDYIDSCRAVIEALGTPVRIEAIVEMGDRVEEYRRLIEDHRIDLLILNTWDGDQLAMHGQAYPLAVELRGIPLLML